LENSVAVWQNLSGCLGGLDNLIIYLLKNCHLLSKKIVSIFTFWFYFHIFENKVLGKVSIFYELIPSNINQQPRAEAA